MGYSDPIYPLNGHCSVVYDGTLYVYSSAGFQSLKLAEGAQWKPLPMDISLTGAQCVKAASAGDSNEAMLYIVGGRVNETAATWNYPGLMHYSFAQKKWDWVRPESWTTQNRVNHGATYLESSKKLLVYSGSQTDGDNGPSSQTFLMSTVSPFNVQSMPSAGAPPSVKPMLMPMDQGSALLAGGGPANTALWKFSEAGGWQDMRVPLQQPIVNPEAVQCTVVAGKGKSMVLEKFDMGVVPNKVDRILLVQEDGAPAAVGATVGAKTKRLATVDNWPAYNATFAPNSLRSGYSLAQGDNGLTVASGGNQANPIVVFDARENSWINATAMFEGQQVIVNSESSSTMSSTGVPTSTATLSATPSATDSGAVVAPAASSNKGKMLTVLGATLGTIFGIAAVLIMVLLCLKYRKNKNKQSHGYIEKSDRMSFADRGADFMKEAGGSVSSNPYHMNNDSHSSLAIIQGRGVGHKKNMASDASTAGLVKKSSPLGYSEPVELSKFDLKPEPVEKMVRQNSGRTPPVTKSNPRSRSSGWSRYFANNEATNLANVQADRSTYVSDRSSIASQSQYTNSNVYSSQPTQHLAPLQIPKFEGQRLSRVASGSPTLGSSAVTLPHQVQPMQAELERANSIASTRSGISHNDEHYFDKPVESWTPMDRDGANHRSSSNYTGSIVFESNNRKNDGTSSFYPDNTDSFYPKSNFSSFYAGQRDARDSSHTMFPSGNAPSAPVDEIPKSTFSSMYPSPPQLDLPQDRESTLTLFPGRNAPQATTTAPTNNPSSFYPSPRVGHESTVTMFPSPGGGTQDKAKDGQSDMSWLNLGASR